MKNLFASLVALIILAATSTVFASPISSDGYFEGIKLCGRVRVVDSFADIKVEVVDSFPDLKVKVVSAFPDEIGEWQFVSGGEDFTIQFVDSLADIKIEFVDAFPGL